MSELKKKKYSAILYDKQATDNVICVHYSPFFHVLCILEYVLDDSNTTVQIFNPAGKIQLSLIYMKEEKEKNMFCI